MSRKLEFVCPRCGGSRIERVFTDALAFTDVTLYEDSADDVYGEITIAGEKFYCFQCTECEWRIPSTGYGTSVDTATEALRRWLKEQPINMLEDI